MAKKFTQTEVDQGALFALKLMLHLYQGKEIDYNDKGKFTADMFERLDTDKDGALKYRELKALAFQIDEPLATQMLEKHTNSVKRGFAGATNLTLATKADFGDKFPEYINTLDKISNTDNHYDGKISAVELVAEIDILEKTLGVQKSSVPTAIRKQTKAEEKKYRTIKEDFATVKDFYDKDKDGEMSLDEMKAMFKECDKDGSDSFSPPEMRAALSAIKSAQK
jgi:Ca2+-binding EF-hand superfamily protein